MRYLAGGHHFHALNWRTVTICLSFYSSLATVLIRIGMTCAAFSSRQTAAKYHVSVAHEYKDVNWRPSAN